MPASRLVFGFVLAAVVAASDRPLAADTWIEVRSPHFTVVSNAGDGTARHFAWQFEQVRSALEVGWPWAKAELDRPALIIVAKDVTTMRLLLPQDWEGPKQIHYTSYAWTGNDRHYFVIQGDARESDAPEGVNPYRQPYWTYGYTALRSGLQGHMPFWLAHGLSEVLANTIVLRTGIESGRPIPDYVRELALGRFPLDRLFAITEESPEFHNDVTRGRFVAECWAVAQYLLYGTPGPEGAARANAFAQLILQGMQTPAAVANVFGSVAALDTAYQLQLDQGRFRYVTWKVDVSVNEKAFTSRPMRPAEAAAVRGAWYVTSQRPVEARAAIADARKIEPDLASTFSAEGRLLEVEHKPDEAARAFARAVELGSDNFFDYYSAAQALMNGARDPEVLSRARPLLTRAIALNDRYAWTHYYLGSLYLSLNQASDAVPELRQAVACDPRAVQPHLVLARALLRLSQRDEALAEAREAMAVATTDADRRTAQALLDEIGR